MGIFQVDLRLFRPSHHHLPQAVNEYPKVVLSGKNLYKEIEITPDMEFLTVGTAMDAGVRLRKELFFGDIQLKFQIGAA